MRQFVLVLLVVALSLGAAYALISAREEPDVSPPAAEIPLVEVATVELNPIELYVDTFGELRPRREGSLTAEVGGTITKATDSFVDGGAVKEGEPLLSIDAGPYDVALLAAKAQVAQAAAALSREEAEAERSIAEWRRAGRDEDPPPLVAREPALAEARARAASAAAALEEAKLDVERTQVRAPFAGFLRDARVSVGEFVQPGQVLGTLYQADPMEVSFALTDRELARLDLDALLGDVAANAPAVRFQTSFGGRSATFRGRVARVESEVDAVSRMVRLTAVVEGALENGESVGGALPLLSGVFVDARIQGRRIDAAAELPRSALFRPDMVLVVTGEGRLERRDVEVALSTRDTAVISSGLDRGEQVIISPLQVAIDGMFVRVQGDAR